MNRISIAAAVAVMMVAGCGGSSDPAVDIMEDSNVATDINVDNGQPDASVVGDVVDSVEPDTTDSGTELPVEVQEDAAPEIWYPPVTPPLPFGPDNRGYIEKRGLVHMHSRWSHDGCFPDHEEITNEEIEACGTTYTDPTEQENCREALRDQLLEECVDEYRYALCSNRIDFVFQTDHPSDVRFQTFEDALYHRPEEGDEMVNDLQERQLANHVTCAEEFGSHEYYFYFGTEGSKQMPIGLAGPVPEIIFNTSYDLDTPIEDAQTAIAAVHDQGGWALACHTEADDISAQRIVDLPLDLMEIFNFHPALMEILYDMDILFYLDRFMASDENAPNPDLSVMTILKPVANNPLRFDEAVMSIRLGHILATDIHRNVEIPSLCETAETCGDNWIETYPNLARLLANGGPAILGDGYRMDSYLRSLRWATNRALVAIDGTDYLNISDAIGRGRSYSAFDILGMPQGFDFFAVVDGEALEMGQEISDYTDAKIYIRTPTIEKPFWADNDFGDASDTEIVTKLIRINEADGSQVVQEIMGQGWTFEYQVDGPAVYRIEIWMTPKHLAADLGDMAWLADGEYPWIYSNALFFR